MMAFRYVALFYLKYFLIILFALVLFMVGFDYIEHSKSLPNSANLIFIYVLYTMFYAIDILLPLSLVIAMIATKVALIRNNALVAFYSLGYSKNDILRPFIVVSALMVLLFIALHATPFAKGSEYAQNIRERSQFIKPTTNLFFVYKNDYIYFGQLYPLQNRAESIRVFKMKNGSLSKIVTAKNAYFEHDRWVLKNAIIIDKPRNMSFDMEGIDVKKQESIQLLKDFKPAILNQVYEGKVNFTIIDAIEALILLNDENINMDKIRSALYRAFIYPFFVPFLVIVIFYFVPISPRFLNVSLFTFGAILTTILVWAVLFTLIELSVNQAISSEVGIVLPVVILALIAMSVRRRNL